jgi:hypothetical protein
VKENPQLDNGSCNPVPMGSIPSRDKMPSCKFTFPKNGGTVPADKVFTITMKTKNLNTGSFVNANTNYFSGRLFLEFQSAPF